MSLSPKHIARLSLLHPLAQKGKLAPDSPEAAEYQRLVVAQQAGVDPPEASETVAHPSLPGGPGTTSEEQAAFYAVSRPTIFLWKKKGAPLTYPPDMPAWFSRTFPGTPINPKILRAVARGSAPPARFALSLPSVPAPPSPVDDKAGLDATHRRMCDQEVRLYARMQQFEAEGNLPQADLMRSDWLKLSGILAAADSKQIRNAIARGDLVQRAAVETEYAALLVHLPETLRAGMKAIRVKMDPAPPAQQWEHDVDAALDEFFRAFPALLLANLEGQTAATAA